MGAVEGNVFRNFGEIHLLFITDTFIIHSRTFFKNFF